MRQPMVSPPAKPEDGPRLSDDAQGPSPAEAPSADAHDLQLVAEIRAGQPGAWQRLLTRHQDGLFGVCYRMVGTGPRAREIAGDLTQDAMVKIIQGLGSFNGQAKLSTWMVRVTMNVCLSWQRGQQHRRHASLDAPAGGIAGSLGFDRNGVGGTFAELLQSREPGGGSGVQREEARGKMGQALAELDGEQRALLILRDVRDMDYGQIAEVLGVPVGTVKSRLFRARSALRSAYERLCRSGGDRDV